MKYKIREDKNEKKILDVDIYLNNSATISEKKTILNTPLSNFTLKNLKKSGDLKKINYKVRGSMLD